MITLFALTGLMFWLSVVASFSWLCWAVHRDYYGYATIDIILVLALWSVTGNIPVITIWHSMQTDPTHALIWVGGYLGIGVVWATVKWKLVLRKLKARFDEWVKGREAHEKREAQRIAERAAADAERAARNPSPQDANRQAYVEEPRPYDLAGDLVRSGLSLQDGKPKVDVAHYRKRIMGWMSYWPASALLWVFGDLLADVFDQLYRMVRGFFQRMADSEFR